MCAETFKKIVILGTTVGNIGIFVMSQGGAGCTFFKSVTQDLSPTTMQDRKIENCQLCRDKGLLKSFTEIYVSVCLDKYFTSTATF